MDKMLRWSLRLGQNVTVDVVNLDEMSRQRRKEIEEMSEEDIQAEIKKTEETLRKKVEASGSRTQRSGMQSLPLTMAILCLVGRQVDAFTAYDNQSIKQEQYSRIALALGAQHLCCVRQNRGD